MTLSAFYTNIAYMFYIYKTTNIRQLCFNANDNTTFFHFKIC